MKITLERHGDYPTQYYRFSVEGNLSDTKIATPSLHAHMRMVNEFRLAEAMYAQFRAYYGDYLLDNSEQKVYYELFQNKP